MMKKTIIQAPQIASGILSALMVWTGGAMMILTAAARLGLDQSSIVSWIFTVYVAGGILNIWLAVKYKIPFAGAHSLTAAAFLSMSAMEVSVPYLVGSFIMAGAIIVILGITGLFQKLLHAIPKTIIDAMLAGLILHYVVDIVPVFQHAPIVAILSLLGYFIIPKISKALPPLLGVLIFGIVGLLLVYDFPAMTQLPFSLPQFTIPKFSATYLLSLSLPIAILIISNDLAVALAALKNNGYDVPTNKAIMMSGIATVAGGFFAGHAITVGGMMTTVCSSEQTGEKDVRYKAGVVSSIFVILFGLFAWKLVSLIQLLPSYFIAIITGFSLLNILMNSLKSAFQHHSYRISAFLAFIIAIANVSFFGISAALWSLLIGTIAAKWYKESDTISINITNQNKQQLKEEP
ncbi:benzoate/H(+) symporter BenE family transporter [Paenibacillus yanchengensis]|uniref:Benzoate/H(+) symporter BenE family transporter n=1 Tax=Paenibacillus yanchengensis TaxID=2035833 RepID=A0ABW4YI20_9BACL